MPPKNICAHIRFFSFCWWFFALVGLLQFYNVEASFFQSIKSKEKPATTTTTPPTAPSSSTTSIANCCPYGSAITKHMNGDENIICLQENESNLGASYVFGYNIGDIPEHYNGTWHCMQNDSNVQQRIIPLEAAGTRDLELSAETCVTQTIEKELSAVTCSKPAIESTSQQHQYHVSFVHKCCPLQYVYDVQNAKCVLLHDQANRTAHFDVYGALLHDSPSSTSTLSSSQNAAIFLDTPINCPRDRVVVEYHMRSERILLHDGMITLNGDATRRYNFNEYCLEYMNRNHISNNNVGQLHKIVEKVQEQMRVLISSNQYNINNDGNQFDEFIVRVCESMNVCNLIPCIRRCCADGEMFTKGNETSYCRKDESDVPFHSFDSLEISGNFTKPTVFGVLRSLDCSKYRLDPDAYSDESHTISERDGSLYVHSTKKKYMNHEYCVEKIRNATWGDQKLYTFLCFDSKVVGNDRIRFKLYPIGLLISCCFYIATLFVYLSIPKLRNLPGKILICLVCSLFAAYLSIALGQLMPAPNDDVCFCTGFFVYFCLMAAFAWMNVTCFDIWQTFGSSRSKRGIKTRQTKRFIIYSAYGWGWPTLLTVVTVCLTKSDILSDNLRPQFGHGRCWFTYDALGSANLLFFSGPIGILFLINFILFLMTLRYCNKVKREIFRMQSSNNEKPALRRRFVLDKARFGMNTKLFMVMGITWLLELMSILLYDHQKTFFWVISDSFNVLLGVIVFIIFVFKKRIWILILERFGFSTSGSSKSTAPNFTCATPSTFMPSTSMTNLNTIDGNAKLLSVRNNVATTTLQIP